MSESFKWNPGQQKALDDVLYSGARFNLLYGGSRSGKTVLFGGTIIDRGLFAPKSKHLIVRKEASSARAALARGNLATIPMTVRMRYPGMEITWNEKYGYFELPNESEIWIGGLNDEKAMERILGNEYATIYKNECSEINYAAHTLLRSRLAQQVKTLDGDYLSQRDYNDLNPTTRNHWTYRLFRDLIDPDGEKPVDSKQYKWGVINPMDNLANLSADYIADLESMSSRAKKRFFLGEYVEDVENALWSRRMIRRVQEHPDLSRIVVAIDPAVSNNIGSDETGIIGAGVDGGGNGYTLADDSGKYSPDQWAKKAIALYDYLDADCIVAEVNQGGDMVETVIRAHRPDIPYKAVRATRGKYVRAEPVAALYERNKVYHVGDFPELEDQMCAFTSDFDRKSQGYSPDRVDAVVWAYTDLFPKMTRRKSSSKPIVRNLGTRA